MTRDPLQVRLSGRGGQGVILAGVLLAEAGMHDGHQVVHTQSYGPAARLGAALSEVVLSESEIAFPEVTMPDLLLCLSREAYAKYGGALAADGLRVVEARVAEEVEVRDALVLPILRTAAEAGDIIAANVVALGALTALSGAVTPENLRRAVRERVKPDYVELNLRALDAGLDLGRSEARGRHEPSPASGG